MKRVWRRAESRRKRVKNLLHGPTTKSYTLPCLGLKARGIEVPYIVKANEGHGFSNEENRFEFYRAMEEFLGKHLGGRVEKTGE